LSFYPIFIDLSGKRVLVVGGGRVAQRKIETFLHYDAHVSIIAMEITHQLERYVKEGKIIFLGREFNEDAMTGATLVIAATDDPQLNSKISKRAKKMGLPVNAVDQPSDCSFIVPSIVRRGDLQIAVSTAGKSPALAKKLRKELEKQFGAHYEAFLILMGKIREEILEKGLSKEDNHRIFKGLVNSSILKAIETEDWMEVASIVSAILNTRVSSDDIINYIKV